MAVNDGENVVEIVGDAAGKLADGLHFLRLAQLFLQPPLRGDVAEQAQQQQRLAVRLDKGIVDFQSDRMRRCATCNGVRSCARRRA